jgi:S-adenosylmethionine:diacylglycerol 3-amino-3-carboxypropyl transferase
MRRSDGTAWAEGRFDGRAGPRAILFGRMYEDPTVELEAFAPGGRVLCIASAGCTARRLSARHDVVAVDINPVQLDYARRRLAGAPAQLGTAERVMAALRRLLPVAGVSAAALRRLLDLEEPAAQVALWRELATRRLRLGMDALFSLAGLRAVYASPFLTMLPPRFGRVLLARLERGFATHPNRTNPYPRLLLLGEGEADDPPGPGRIELVCADAAGYLETQPEGSFRGFTLSNILDGAGEAYRARLLAAVRRAAAPGAKVVLRSFGGDDPAAARDRSMIWGTLTVASAGELR